MIFIVIVAGHNEEGEKVVRLLGLSKGTYIISTSPKSLYGLHGEISFIFTKGSESLKNIDHLRQVAKEVSCNNTNYIMLSEVV